MSEPLERVGVVVVHGIGEQRRFEHLDGQVRSVIDAFRAREAKVTVEIKSAADGAFHAEQDTWRAGPTVYALVDDPRSGKRLGIHFHEVWWADVNEPHSLFKQFRFWRWALALWLYPDKKDSVRPTAWAVRPPEILGRPKWRASLDKIWTRARLFGVAFLAVVGATSVGLVTFFAERVLNLRPPNVIRVFVSYLAGVMLYNQKTRFGIGFPAEPQDFLDTLAEPPRVSVRRRMIRTILETAGENYDRWYVLAHSLGSVVAFNGLMETAYAWPGYLDGNQCFQAVSRNFAGEARQDWQAPAPNEEVSPRRPVWAPQNLVAYRSHIFQKFHGLLTFGSPLEKFATIWPARVPISKEPAFRPGTTWLNIYDPIDPVSGVLRAFNGGPQSCCPEPQNIGYAAGNVLLVNHLAYLNGPNNASSLTDGVAEWLITGNSGRISKTAGVRWFAAYGSRHWKRSAAAWCWWIVSVLLLAIVGGLVLPIVWSAVTAMVAKLNQHVTDWLGANQF